MKTNQTVTVDNKQVPIEGERNLLELIRKAGVEIPTFCYHSEMSIYGACRLCMVDVEGLGMVASCSTVPTPGMVVKTSTPEIRETRKMILELLLASHQGDCQTCRKGDDCKLLALANRLGVRDIRFKRKGPQPSPGSVLPVHRARPQQVHPLRRLRADVLRNPGRGRHWLCPPGRGLHRHPLL